MRNLILALTFFTSTFPSFSAIAQNRVRDYRRANEPRILEEFVTLLKIPNVASDRGNIRKNANLLVQMMKRRGLNPSLLEASGPDVPPVVFGEWKVPNANRTIILYAHYDGQPTDAKQWDGSLPWQPVIRSAALESGGKILTMPKPGESINPEWRLYARSASDDKAGVMAILTAVDALKAQGLAPTLNIRFFFDGEEEAGSPHLGEIIRLHKTLLEADAWIICDGPVHQSGRKQVVFGVRGDTNVDVTVYGSKRPLHSGHYGNWSPNPALMLAKLLSSMKDESGRVAISGWYDSLNINGMSSGDVGSLARNVIPTTATAVLDLRLVKGVDFRRQVERLVDHIRKQGFHVIGRDPTDEERRKYPLIAKLIHRAGGYNAERTKMDLPISLAIIDAVQSTLGDPIIKLPTSGGSLPLSIITNNLPTVTITVPIANYDNNQHAENENIRLQNLWDGIETMAALMTMGNFAGSATAP